MLRMEFLVGTAGKLSIIRLRVHPDSVFGIHSHPAVILAPISTTTSYNQRVWLLPSIASESCRRRSV